MNRLIIVLTLWLAGLLAAAQFAKIGVPFAELRAAYPDAGDALGWMLSSISAVGAVLGTVAGTLATRLGLRRILLVGMVVGGSASLAQMTLPALPIMLALRGIEGASHLAMVVAAPTLIAQAATDAWRGAAMTLWSTFFGVAFALTAFLGLPLVASHGLPTLFALHGVAMLVLAAVLYAVLPRDASNPAAAQGVAPASFWRRNARAYGDPRVSAAGYGWLFYTLTFVAFLALLPDRVPETHRAGTAMAMSLGSIAVSLLIVPVLLRRVTGVFVVIAGFAAGIGVFLAATILPMPVVAIALFTALGLVQGASFAAVPQLNTGPDSQAMAYGLMAQMGNLGNLLGTPLFLWILGTGGEPALFMAGALFYALAILTHLIQARRRTSRTG